ncbi:MAG: hypothetical protein MPJ22_14190, partial [Pirellulales bacterium]|nr:hypothetical protein [Pirellulales bacterium]
MKNLLPALFLIFFPCFVSQAPIAFSQNLTDQLLDQNSGSLISQIKMRGDPIRGGVLFHTSTTGCVKCHSAGESPSPLGPKLTDIDPSISDAYLIESVLKPSQV